MIRFYLPCIFLCAPFFIKAQEKLADSLFKAREFLPARVAYERVLFNETKRANELLLKKSYCLKAEAKHEEAYSTLQRADFFNGSDSLKFNLYYESALNAYLAGKYDLSLNKIQELNYYIPSISNSIVTLLEILSLNQLQKITEAEKRFKELAANSKLQGTSKIYDGVKLKNPEKAESISHLLPGVGQMYAGYLGRGFTSMVIQSGLIVFTGYNFWNGYYFSGAFTGVGLFYMFNNGGARHAQYLAEKKNREIIERLNEKVKQVIQNTRKK